ncbi:hypothetical protein [Streptomyces carpinensis]|uniref:Uncharacterized protein n=1 Tax=Streptomyces carpinensis TaxID=66369 RepID=A0ABV1WHB2_9ACTN|nr:hypothetical protein [Streptomyces carpinensis]
MPHVLTTILTQVAIALLEAALLRLSIQLWKAFTAGGESATAHA